MAEYFGGVLASSRSTIPRDDRAATYLVTLERLSTYEVRAHYVFYLVFSLLFRDRDFGGATNTLHGWKVFISDDTFGEMMDFTGEENRDQLTSHAVLGLNKESLIGPELTMGTGEVLSKQFPVTEGGIVIAPSLPGMDLFGWVHGWPSISPNDFFKVASGFPDLAGVKLDLTRFQPLNG